MKTLSEQEFCVLRSSANSLCVFALFFFFMSALVARFNFALLFFAYYVGVKLPLFLTQEKLVCVVVLW